MSDTSYPKEILFSMRDVVNLFENDVDSERWKHFNKWDIQEALEEYSKWFKEILNQMESLNDSSPTSKMEVAE